MSGMNLLRLSLLLCQNNWLPEWKEWQIWYNLISVIFWWDHMTWSSYNQTRKIYFRRTRYEGEELLVIVVTKKKKINCKIIIKYSLSTAKTYLRMYEVRIPIAPNNMPHLGTPSRYTLTQWPESCKKCLILCLDPWLISRAWMLPS